MKKKKIQKTTTVLITLIVLAVAAIAAIVLWDREETTGVKPPHLPKEQAEGLREAAKAQRHKTEDGAQLARIAPPRSAARQVAIVIDDIGYDMKPVRELLRLVHVEQIDIQRIKRDDMEVVDYLKSEDPELFKSLKKSARAHAKKAA